MTEHHRRAARIRRAVGIAAVAACGLLAGCTAAASGAGEPREPVVDATPIALDGADLHLPVEAYQVSTEQGYRYGRARLKLIGRCLAGFGINYAVEQPAIAGYGPRSLVDRRYGVTDAVVTRTAGYGLGPRDPAKAPRPKQPELNPDGRTVLSGQGRSVVRGRPVPDGGCLGEADRTLQASMPAGVELRLPDQLAQHTFAESRQDSRVVRVIAAWSACMRDAGFRYADPLAPPADPAFGTPADAGQLAVARADIDCKRQTNLVGVWFAVESAYQRREIDAQHTTFDLIQRALTARDRVASAVR